MLTFTAMSIVRGVAKLTALLGGAVITVVSLMALVGVHTDSGWARAAIAIVVALAVPLFVVERILARLPPDKVRGVTTDALAVIYLAFSLAFVGVAHGFARPRLAAEAHRLDAAGVGSLARVTEFLAGGRGAPRAPAPAEKPDPAVTATASSAPPAAAGPTPPAPAGKDEKPPAVAGTKPVEARPGEVKPGELRPGDGQSRTPAQIFSEFAPSVVTISVKMPAGDGGGTGFVVDRSGTIATNYHVIDHASEIKVKLMDGTVADEVEVLVENEPNDLALLHIKTAAKLTPVVLGDSDKVVVGEHAVSIGNPLGLEHTLTDGLISSRRVIDGRKMIQMSAPISPGNSGGPLFDSRGEVIGISTASYLGHSLLGQNLNLAMPINDLRAMIRDDYPTRHKVGERAPAGGNW
jgi:hypothetical protein